MHTYEVTIGIRQDYRVVYRNFPVESKHPMTVQEIKAIALSKVHVHVRYLARVTDIYPDPSIQAKPPTASS